MRAGMTVCASGWSSGRRTRPSGCYGTLFLGGIGDGRGKEGVSDRPVANVGPLPGMVGNGVSVGRRLDVGEDDEDDEDVRE